MNFAYLNRRREQKHDDAGIDRLRHRVLKKGGKAQASTAYGSMGFARVVDMIYVLWSVPVSFGVLYAYVLPAAWLVVPLCGEAHNAPTNTIVRVDITESDRAETDRRLRRLLPERCMS